MPVISAKVIKDGRIIEPIDQTISPDYYAEWMRRGVPKDGDVVMTTEGPLGEVARLNKETSRYALGQRVVTLRGNPNVLDNGYLKYLLISTPMQDRLHAMATGSTVAGISQKSLRRMLVPIAPIADQRRISSVLGALDDKIQVNRQIADTLEAMTHALYKSWFVDFDPVWAKLEARDPCHMDSLTANLFPEVFDSEGLPQGWKSGTVGDLVEFNPRERIAQGAVAPYLDMKSLHTRGLNTELPILRKFSSGTKFRSMDTLLARITPCLENGKTAVVGDLGLNVVGWGSTEFIVMRARLGVPASLPYCFARDQAFRDEAIATMTGSSGRQRADATRIAALPSAIPDGPVLAAFGLITMPWIQRIQDIGSENATLAEMRDTLLPKLMSGEIRIGEARELYGEVA